MPVGHRAKILLSILIIGLGLGYLAIDRLGYIDRLPPHAALILGLAFVFVGGIVAGVSGFYFWICWKVRRRPSRTEEHAT